MSYKFIQETPEAHKPFTATHRIEFTCADEASLDEMLESFSYFLRASGYHIDGYIDVVPHNIDKDLSHNET
jgi:hypothetical protein